MMYVLHLEKHKLQRIKNHNINTEIGLLTDIQKEKKKSMKELSAVNVGGLSVDGSIHGLWTPGKTFFPTYPK